MDVRIKRVYEATSDDDGYRVLVDRLWPRGVKKTDLAMNLWGRFLAPSTEARKEFAHKAENFAAFKTRYLMELDANPEACQFASDVLEGRVTMPDGRAVSHLTLLYAAKNPQVNHAVVLKQWLDGERGD